MIWRGNIIPWVTDEIWGGKVSHSRSHKLGRDRARILTWVCLTPKTGPFLSLSGCHYWVQRSHKGQPTDSWQLSPFTVGIDWTSWGHGVVKHLVSWRFAISTYLIPLRFFFHWEYIFLIKNVNSPSRFKLVLVKVAVDVNFCNNAYIINYFKWEFRGHALSIHPSRVQV